MKAERYSIQSKRNASDEWRVIGEADDATMAGAVLAGHVCGSVMRGLSLIFRVVLDDTTVVATVGSQGVGGRDDDDRS